MNTSQMRIVFYGTPEFSVPSLEKLVAEGYNVVGVVTAPDKKSGRGLKVTSVPVKECADRLQIPTLQPTNLKDPEFLDALKAWNADLQIVIAFRMLPESVWNMPPKGTFNLHASLLPNYRGAAPINWAIINGEKETGCTTFFLKHEIDTGDLIDFFKEPISDDDNVGSLYERLMNKGADLVVSSVAKIASGNYTLKPQILIGTEKKAPKIFTETCVINWEQTAEEIHNFVRGLAPYPVAKTYINHKLFKIHKTEKLDKELQQDLETDNKTYLHLKTGKGTISILEIQMEGKKKMNIGEFLRGSKI